MKIFQYCSVYYFEQTSNKYELVKYINNVQNRMLLKIFIASQCICTPLMWALIDDCCVDFY